MPGWLWGCLSPSSPTFTAPPWPACSPGRSGRGPEDDRAAPGHRVAGGAQTGGRTAPPRCRQGAARHGGCPGRPSTADTSLPGTLQDRFGHCDHLGRRQPHARCAQAVDGPPAICLVDDQQRGQAVVVGAVALGLQPATLTLKTPSQVLRDRSRLTRVDEISAAILPRSQVAFELADADTHPVSHPAQIPTSCCVALGPTQQVGDGLPDEGVRADALWCDRLRA